MKPLLSRVVDNPRALENRLQTEKSVVYRITNLINGRRYIGKTINTFYHRYRVGRWWDAVLNPFLKADIEKFGHENFEADIVNIEPDPVQLVISESIAIQCYNSLYPIGYNLKLDTDPTNEFGDSGTILIYNKKQDKMVPISKSSLSQYKRAYRNFVIGAFSEETRKKQSSSRKGRVMTPEQRKKISDLLKGRKQTPELIAKRSKARQRQIQQIDANTGELIADYSCAEEAARFFGLTIRSNIIAVCRGKRKTAGGHVFRYKP